MKNSNKKNLWTGLIVVVTVLVIIAIIGAIALRPEPETLMGEVEAAEYRLAGKVPGRINEFRVHEGDQVHAGDTLAVFDNPEVMAKYGQATAARQAAQAQQQKAHNGARQEQITGAYEIWQKAKVGVDITKKSLDRVKNLYEKGLVPAQKYDEVEAQYNAAIATANAAESQYLMASNGAESTDKAAARALVARADGAVAEVTSYMNEKYLFTPVDGEVVEIYPRCGELVNTGSPVVSVVDLSDVWFTFSVREDLLHGLSVGQVVKVNIPALGDETYSAKVTFMRPMASYATWRATKNNGQYDVKSFDIKLVPTEPIQNLRPGMTAIISEKDLK